MTQKRKPGKNSFYYKDAVPATPDAFRDRMRATYRQMSASDRSLPQRRVLRFAACAATAALLCALALFLRPDSIPDTLAAAPTAAATAAPGGVVLTKYTLTPEEYLRDTSVCCAPSDPYYHKTYPVCLEDAYTTNMTAWSAAKLGKTPCPKCLPIDETTLSTMSEPSIIEAIRESADKVQVGEYVCDAPEYVAGALHSVYYHESADCEGITGDAVYITKRQAIALEKLPCPICSGGVEAMAYRAESDETYHTNNRCAALARGSKLANVRNIEKQGCRLCPYCEGRVYSDGIPMYHIDENCGNYDASASALAPWSVAVESEMRPCFVCCVFPELDKILFPETDASHVNTSTLSEPINTSTLSEPINTSTLGEPIVNVYATATGVMYHKIPDCNGMKNASSISLIEAEASGKYACGVCFGGNVAEIMIDAALANTASGSAEQTKESAETLFSGTALWPEFRGLRFGMDMRYVLLYEESRSTPFTRYRDLSTDDLPYFLYRREAENILGEKGILQYHFVDDTFTQVDCAVTFTEADKASAYMRTALRELYGVYGLPTAVSSEYADLYVQENWFANENDMQSAVSAAKEYDESDPSGATKLCAQWKPEAVPLSQSPAETMRPLIEIHCQTPENSAPTVIIRLSNAYRAVSEETMGALPASK